MLYRHTNEVEQMMACLLAEIRTDKEKMDANQAKTDANQRGMRERMRDGQKHLKEEMRAGQELLKQEMLAKLDAHHERMTAKMDTQLKKIEACLEKAEAKVLEANPEEIDSESEHQEVPKGQVAVDTVEALENRFGDWHLAVGHRRQPNKRTQSDGGSRKKLTRRARTARRNGRGHKGPMVEKRRRKGPKCNNDIRNRVARRQVRLKKERTTDTGN
jgi:hypothetical protein